MRRSHLAILASFAAFSGLAAFFGPLPALADAPPPSAEAPPAADAPTEGDAPQPAAAPAEAAPLQVAVPPSRPAPAAPPVPPRALAGPPPAPRGLVITPSGQLLARFRHLEGRDFAPGGVTNTVTQRARAGLHFALNPVSVLVELQDVRIWGAETDTLADFSADHFDLHQGYVQVNLAPRLSLRIGRQEVDWLGQRLIGSVAWIEQARSLDAARLAWEAEDGRLKLDAFYARTRDGILPDDTRAEHVAGALLSWQLHPAFAPSFLAIVDTNGPTDRTRVTTGVHVDGSLDMGLSYTGEFFFQAGAVGDGDIAAFLAALHVRQTFDVGLRPWVEVFGELVSGDDDPADTTIRSFDTLFATNHKFYGEMDFFLNLPAQTAQRGLVDIGAAVGLQPRPDLDLSLTFHHFLVHEAQGGADTFGSELDLRGEWRLSKHFRLDLVYAFFAPGEAFTGGAREANLEHFVYSTVHARF